MTPSATNRQRKVLRFFGIPFGADLTLSAASWEIDGLLADPENQERWRRYVYLTGDLDSDTDELRAFDESQLQSVSVPDGWETDAAVQVYREELVQRVVSEEGPFDSPGPAIRCEGRVFCFTGKFEFGTRRECERAVSERGGSAEPSVSRDVDYLVVGTKGSPIWKRGSYGSKIERAIVLRREAGKPAIVSEQHWRSELGLA